MLEELELVGQCRGTRFNLNPFLGMVQFEPCQNDQSGWVNGAGGQGAYFAPVSETGEDAETASTAVLPPDSNEEMSAVNEHNSLGQAHRGNGWSLTLNSFGIDGRYINLDFTLTNVSSDDIVVRYRNSAFRMSDHVGTTYTNRGDESNKNQKLAPGESVQIVSYTSRLSRFVYIGSYAGPVSETAQFLIVTVSGFMHLPDMKWQIDLF
jgi:hypothetical protein